MHPNVLATVRGSRRRCEWPPRRRRWPANSDEDRQLRWFERQRKDKVELSEQAIEWKTREHGEFWPTI